MEGNLRGLGVSAREQRGQFAVFCFVCVIFIELAAGLTGETIFFPFCSTPETHMEPEVEI